MTFNQDKLNLDVPLTIQAHTFKSELILSHYHCSSCTWLMFSIFYWCFRVFLYLYFYSKLLLFNLIQTVLENTEYEKINISKFIFFPEISEPLTWTWYVISLTDDIVLYCLQLVGTSRLLLSWFYGLYIAVSFLNIDYIYLNFSNNNNKGKIWRSISL